MTLNQTKDQTSFGSAGEAWDTLEILIGRAHAPEPDDREKADRALLAIFLAGGRSYAPAEFWRDVEAALQILAAHQQWTEVNQRRDSLQAERDQIITERQAIEKGPKGMDGLPLNPGNYRSIAARLAQNDLAFGQRNSLLAGLKVKLDEAVAKSERARNALRRAGFDFILR
jgi:hypothetical protein